MSDDMATTIEREAAQRPGRPSAAAREPPEPAKAGGNERTVFIIMGVVLLGLVAVGVRRWIYSLSHVSTDNAQVDGHIIPILPKVGGYVVEVRTDENRQVKAGDTLVVLDDRDYKARLAQAEADLAVRSEEHTSELQSLAYLVCRLLLEKKKTKQQRATP